MYVSALWIASEHVLTFHRFPHQLMSWCNLFHDFEKVFIEFVTILLLFFMFWSFGHPRARGISAPRPRIESAPPALEGKVLTAGAPGTSHEFIWSLMYLHLYLRMVFIFPLFISLKKVYRCIHIHTQKHKHIYTHIGTLTYMKVKIKDFQCLFSYSEAYFVFLALNPLLYWIG